MRRLLLICPILVCLSMFFVSCEKQDQPIVLPPPSGAQHASVDMGEDYTDQVFYNLASGKIVYTSKVSSWHLAFESTPLGYHIYINGERDFSVFNTHRTEMQDVYDTSMVNGKPWQIDDYNGTSNATAIGEWLNGAGSSKREVFILKCNPGDIADTFLKIQLGYTSEGYILTYGKLRDNAPKTVVIPKDHNYNFVFFSLKDERITTPEPPKNTWDIVFTHYRSTQLIYNNAVFPYQVSGVLLNASNTTAAVDSVTPYQNMNADKISGMHFSDARDIIGFNWKDYDRVVGHYTVKQNKVYVIKTQDNKYFKMHFLDFYNAQGIKGNPSFEYEQMQ
ncbi:MAG: HmuY family protein [Bacteroidetes bacterium]|nr:HmuY family protein [Bacteroidota bacterium]